MRILFCDDDPEILTQLQQYVSEFFKTFSTIKPEFAAYTSGDELLKKETSADIAFLDVEMPGISGIYTGAKLKEFNPKIKIFIVTSYPDYLDEAMRFQVFRYLSKPIQKKRLFRNLKDAIYQYSVETKEYPIATMDGVFVRSAEEIVCVEALQRKVTVYTTREILQSTEPMEYWRAALDHYCFYSPYRGYIINMRYVNSFDKDSIALKYCNKTKKAYLARRKYTDFKNTFLMYLESVK